LRGWNVGGYVNGFHLNNLTTVGNKYFEGIIVVHGGIDLFLWISHGGLITYIISFTTYLFKVTDWKCVTIIIPQTISE
jgi:hypothetical protein